MHTSDSRIAIWGEMDGTRQVGEPDEPDGQQKGAGTIHGACQRAD